ncbi:MAG TPA: hypothetical protein VK629_15400 [Steroidobacteraceae bacterium]|nr:hypothetical protein [Steroidobacteraceae bacterium]
MRLLLLIHRYLGIAVGVVMAMWCVSGFVMMYVGFPALDTQQRLRSLEPISWQDCCDFEKLATQLGVDVADQFSVEMVVGRPVLQITLTQGRRFLVDLQSGERLAAIDATTALAVARHFARSLPAKAEPRYLASLERDQWTVQGQLRLDRPLHHLALDDEAGTELYVSSATGQIVQHTTTQQRFWNWLGAVPHWLYPTILRDNAALWSQVVIWLSLAGVFLTVIGIYIGVAHWLAMKGARWSPYRGISLWHHLSGLFFGVLTLTWVGSGLVSMNPWGFLEGSGFSAERASVRDAWIDGPQLADSLKQLAATKPPALTRIESAPLSGKLFLLLYRGTSIQRVTATTLADAPLQSSDVERVAQQLAGDGATQVDLLMDGDNYYYSGHDPVDLPVYRVALDDKDRTRYYVSPLSGDVLGKVDPIQRWYRWLFEGLHRLDFTSFLRQRPWWDLIVLPLLSGVTIVCCTGVFMGYRRLTARKRREGAGG